MASAGLRMGALPLLRVGDLTPIPEHNIYRIRVYANSKSNKYYTFCTPECRKVIDNYLDYRKSCGENITSRSPLLRREFDKHDIFQVANDVRPLTIYGVKKLLADLLYASGLRTLLVTATATIPEHDNNNIVRNTRHPMAMSHGFRKFFDTNCIHSGMNPIYIEFCLGHSLKGVKDSYFLPQPDSSGVYMDILEGHDKSPRYLDAIDFRTINNENRLRRENEMLKIKKSEIEELKEQVAEYKNIQPMFENFQLEINSLKVRLNEEAKKRHKKHKLKQQ
jgi:hypothetical protein